MPGRNRLQARRQRLQPALFCLIRAVPIARVVKRGDQRFLSEVQRVGGGQGRQQPPLMLEVVEQDHLTIIARRPELAARQAVTNRDGKRQLRRAQSGTGYTDASGDKRSEHREESPSLVGDRTGV